MLEVVPLDLAAILPALTTLYWICLIVGGGLLIVSSVAGSHGDAGLDADVGVDVDVGVDADVGLDADVGADVDVGADADVHVGHAHATSLATWFSIQFIVFFMAVFGLIGVTMTYLSDQTSAFTFGGALLGGLIVGQGVHQLLRKLRRTSGDSTPQPQDYVNKLARVTITVAGTRTGEVALRVGRAERFLPAISKRADMTFKSGEQVAVVAYRDGVAEIISREEYEFLTNKS